MLEGVRVLDVSRLLPGAYCTLLLQQQGAEVIKIESRAGDPIRHLPGGPAYFEALHHGQQLMTIDLRSDEGRARLLAEVRSADVLVEGFRPGVMERRQLGFDRLIAANARLVYCAITGYGSMSPLAARAGHDLNYLARSGALSLMPTSAGRPVIPGLQIADLAGGMQASFLIGAALADRARSGKGQRLEVSMTDVMYSWTALARAARSAGTEGMPLTGEVPCYRVYAVSDGFLTVAALEAHFWTEFCRAIGRDDLVPRQFDPSAVAEVEAVVSAQTRAEWMARFADRDVCVEPLLSLEESEVS